VKSVGFRETKRMILHLQPIMQILFYTDSFISLTLNFEVWQVLSPVDPEADGSLYLQDNWNQYFLDHLRVLHTLRVFKHLFYSWVNCRSLRFYSLHLSFGPSLNNLETALKLHLINPHVLVLPY